MPRGRIRLQRWGMIVCAAGWLGCCCAESLASALGPAQPESLAVFHRAGQTFITWRERSELTAEQYQVYRHTSPITADNRSGAVRLYQVPEGSGHFYANRYDVEHTGIWSNRYVENFVITDHGPELAPNQGLLVWTLAAQDFSGALTGTAYYALTTIDRSGLENIQDFSAANSSGPVAEGVADPRPVEIRSFPATFGGGVGHVMIQYMNLREWNPTFHAPHARDRYYGLDPSSYAVTSSLQYAYDYVVIEPLCPTSPAPLYLNLPWRNGDNYGPLQADPEPFGWCTYKIFPVEQNNTWYLGFSRSNDYRTGANPAPGDTVVNYTEYRILRMLRDTILWPPGGIPVDTNRLYVWGHSMAGGGALGMALRYPQVFAAAICSQPMTDHRLSGANGSFDWLTDVEWKWGRVALNLPVQIKAPGGWADHLAAYNGMGAWDWQNFQERLPELAKRETVPLGIGHGSNDMAMDWRTQAQPMYPRLDAARICWGAQVDGSDHHWMGYNLPNPTLSSDVSMNPLRGFSVRRDETVPGLSRCSANGSLPPTLPAFYNRALDWSASWYPWDGAPVDETNIWQMSFRSLTGSNLAVDVTPRRLQAFPRRAGQRVFWQNLSIGGGATNQQATLAADGEGLITVTNFLVSPAGNRLRIVTDGGADRNTNGLPDYWEEAYFGGLLTNSVETDSDGDRISTLNEYRAGTDPLNPASRFVISALESSRVEWVAVPGFRYTIERATNAAHWQPLLMVTSASHQAEASFQAPPNPWWLLRVKALPE